MNIRKLTKIRLLLAAVLFIPVLALSFTVMAHAEEGADAEETVSSQTAEEKKKLLEERLAERKAALEQKLTAAQETRLKARCKSAQGLLKAAEVRIKGVETRRMNAYEKLTNRLNELSTKLKDQGVDTTELDAQLTELQTKVDAFKEQITEYKQSVSDLAAMDCTADPEAFKASLEAARTARAEAVDAAKAIHDYVLGTIKETLKEIKTQLEKDNEGEEDSDGQ